MGTSSEDNHFIFIDLLVWYLKLILTLILLQRPLEIPLDIPHKVQIKVTRSMEPNVSSQIICPSVTADFRCKSSLDHEALAAAAMVPFSSFRPAEQHPQREWDHFPKCQPTQAFCFMSLHL